jgi:hypothetical protein
MVVYQRIKPLSKQAGSLILGMSHFSLDVYTPGWKSIRASIRSSFRREPVGSICKRGGGASSAATRSPASVLPTPRRSSKLPVSQPLSSICEPSPGSGDAHLRRLGVFAVSFVIACNERSTMATVPPVRWAFFPLDEQLGLRSKVGFTPKVEEGMARLGTWMPFRAAQRELAFFLGVDVAEATERQLTEQAGAAQMQVQAAEVEVLLTERPESPAGPEVQLMSLDGALIQVVSGEWKEVKTLALGVESRGEAQANGRSARADDRSLLLFAHERGGALPAGGLGGTVSTRGREGQDGVCSERRSGLDSEVGGLSPSRCGAYSGRGPMRWSM